MPSIELPLRRFLVTKDLPESVSKDRSPWHVVVSSRLGRDLISQRPRIVMVRRFVEQAAKRGERELLVHGTAAQPWANRSCELLGIEPIKLVATDSKSKRDASWQSISLPGTFCRDQFAVEMADRVDASYVRPGGTIMRLLRQRLDRETTPSVQVLINRADDKAAKELIACGAIGYWINDKVGANDCPLRSTNEDGSASAIDSRRVNEPSIVDSILHHPLRWLIHSTRQRTGPWPGQSAGQFADWLLLSSPSTELSSPLETLNRIVKERRLVGSHRTTSAGEAVVSFTSMPMVQWLARRAFRPHLGRWDAEPYGIAVDRAAAARLGIQPVIYGDASVLDALPADQRWRYQAEGNTYDWKEEQEWRACGVIDLSKFNRDEVVVFTRSAEELSKLNAHEWHLVTAESLY